MYRFGIITAKHTIWKLTLSAEKKNIQKVKLHCEKMNEQNNLIFSAFVVRSSKINSKFTPRFYHLHKRRNRRLKKTLQEGSERDEGFSIFPSYSVLEVRNAATSKQVNRFEHYNYVNNTQDLEKQ